MFQGQCSPVSCKLGVFWPVTSLLGNSSVKFSTLATTAHSLRWSRTERTCPTPTEDSQTSAMPCKTARPGFLNLSLAVGKPFGNLHTVLLFCVCLYSLLFCHSSKKLFVYEAIFYMFFNIAVVFVYSTSARTEIVTNPARRSISMFFQQTCMVSWFAWFWFIYTKTKWGFKWKWFFVMGVYRWLLSQDK